MHRFVTPLGIVLGFAAAVLALPFVTDDVQGRKGDVGPIVSDCDGAIRELVIQYNPAAAEIVVPPLRDFLSMLPADVTVHVVCPGEPAFTEFCAQVGDVPCTLSPVIADHEMTSWARDRWIALEPGPDGAVTLLSPKGELGADVWPERRGDQQIGETLARVLAPDVTAVRNGLYFDGGDFVADDHTVFVAPNLLKRNLQRTVSDRAELISRLRRLSGRDVVMLDDAPDHHAGMYMMTVGEGRVIVGDPAAARALLSDTEVAGLPLPGADFSADTAARFDAVARRCEEAGNEVLRIPVAPAKDGRTYLTYLNAILDQRDGRRLVYMPTFEGVETLNDAGAEVWRDAGFEVRRVDCTSSYPHFGSLRCLVNVLRRSPDTRLP